MAQVRRRGRPRTGEAGDRRAAILRAAAAEFAETGYEGATMRAIAARAGVDSALLHHYFGTKADLFAEAVSFPMRPDREVPRLLEGPREHAGERVVRYVLTAWEDPHVRRRGIAVLRTAIGGRAGSAVLTGFLARELLARVATAIGGDQAPLRASLVASQIVGVLVARYAVRIEPLASADVDELVAWLAPTVQRYLTGDAPAPPAPPVE